MAGICGVWRVDDGATDRGARAGSVSVEFDGRLDNRDDVVGRLRDRVRLEADAADSAVVAACYEHFGDEFAAHLVGDFAVAVRDRARRRLLLARDAVGARPFYYTRTPAGVRYATQLKALLQHADVPREPNHTLLSQFALGRLHRHDHDGQSFIAGVSALQPAHVAICAGEAIQVRRYWDFATVRSTPPLGYRDYVDGFRESFDRAVRRRTSATSATAIAVSGGLDSSAIFCAAHHTGADIVGVTFDRPEREGREDEDGVRAIERQTGARVRRVRMSTESPLKHARRHIRQTESPLVHPQTAALLDLHQAASDSGARVWVTGTFGDQVLFDAAYLVDLLRQGRVMAARRHFAAHREYFPENPARDFVLLLLRSLLEHQLPDAARSALRFAGVSIGPRPDATLYTRHVVEAAGPDRFADEPGRDRAAVTRAIYREVRNRYHALWLDWNTGVAAAYGMTAAFPFLDRDLVEFLLAVPGEFLAHDGVPKALLRDALAGVVPDGILRRRTKADFTGYSNVNIHLAFDDIVELLDGSPELVTRGFIERPRLARALAAARQEQERDYHEATPVTEQLLQVAGLEIWLREFAAGGHHKKEDGDGEETERRQRS